MTALMTYWLDLTALDDAVATFERTLGPDTTPKLELDTQEWIKLGWPSRLVIEPKPVEGNDR